MTSPSSLPLLSEKVAILDFGDNNHGLVRVLSHPSNPGEVAIQAIVLAVGFLSLKQAWDLHDGKTVPIKGLLVKDTHIISKDLIDDTKWIEATYAFESYTTHHAKSPICIIGIAHQYGVFERFTNYAHRHIKNGNAVSHHHTDGKKQTLKAETFRLNDIPPTRPPPIVSASRKPSFQITAGPPTRPPPMASASRKPPLQIEASKSLLVPKREEDTQASRLYRHPSSHASGRVKEAGH